MAVSKRAYRSYSGPITSERWRFLVLTRYSLSRLFSSRAFSWFMVFTSLPVLVAGAYIYIRNSQAAQVLLSIGNESLLTVNANFFEKVFMAQAWMALFLTCWAGPLLVAADLANGALPLYLSRPFNRAEYVAGKAAVLFTILSCITWIPDLLLFGLQASLAEPHWVAAHASFAASLSIASLLWIAVLTLISLATSAWVKWRMVATGVTFALFVLPPGFGVILNALLRTYWGRLLNLPYLLEVVVSNLLNVSVQVHDPFSTENVPGLAAWIVLLSVCCAALMLLNWRLRAREVVRG